MAKKWKSYPWQVRSTEGATVDTATTTAATAKIAADEPIHFAADEEEEIDVVGDAAANITAAATASAATVTPTCWGPSSPTAGTTAPSPQPQFTPEEATRDSTLYNGRF